MKTPKAKRLKSGNWNIQVQINGKRYSCTAPTKREAQDKVKQLYAGVEKEKRSPLTVGKAIDKYIAEKTGTLSPSTIRGYMAVRRSYLQSIMDIYLSDLTNSDIQMAISNDSIAGKSPKTIRNSYGLLTATIKEFCPKFIPTVKLPQKKPTEINILTEEELSKVLKACKGTKYELPILLAAWLGLRLSEIRGLKYSDIQNGMIHVQRAVVPSPEGGSVEKGTKTYSGDRWITLPKEIQKLISINYQKEVADYTNGSSMDIKPTDRYICPLTRPMVYHGFIRSCEKAGVKPCRFHDLRHFAASEALALGIPDKYTMQRMGHGTDNMLKSVYQHTMKKHEDEYAERIDEKMRELYDSKEANKKY